MPENKRKTSECKGCGADVIWIMYRGKKHPVDAKTKRGFVFIEDEYGEDIGAVEMASIHESHFATCPKADEFRKDKAAAEEETEGDTDEEATCQGLSPLGEADLRTEILSMPDGSELTIDKDMRRNSPIIYREACEKATARRFEDPANRPCTTEKCENHALIGNAGYCMAVDEYEQCNYRTGGGE